MSAAEGSSEIEQDAEGYADAPLTPEDELAAAPAPAAAAAAATDLTISEATPGQVAVRESSGTPGESASDTGPGRVVVAGVESVAREAGAAVGKAATSRAANAKMVADAIEGTHTRQIAGAASKSSFLKDTATKVKTAAEQAAETGGRAGGREQLKGHFIERLDVATYNAKNKLTGKALDPRTNGRNPAYDASRHIKGKFAGGIQQKSSAAGTEKAISQIEKVKPGSARRATLRVPKDQEALTRARANGRIRVSGMEFTSEQAGKKLDQGITDLAKNGGKATSTARAVAKGAAVGAVINVALGAAGDARALRRGELDGRDFTENRGVDAAEGATNAVVGTAAAATGAAAATAALGTATGAGVAVSVGTTCTAALGTIGGMGSAGAAVAGALGGVTVAAAAPVVIGTAAAVGTGLVVSKGFKKARRHLKAHQQTRKALGARSPTPVLHAAELDGNGQPIAEAIVVVD